MGASKGMVILLFIIVFLLGATVGYIYIILNERIEEMVAAQRILGVQMISLAGGGSTGLKPQTISVSDIKTTGVTKQNRETERVMIIDKLKTCFTVHENQLANSYERTFYLVIIKPDKSVLPNQANDTFPTKEGAKIGYTVKSTITYENKNVKACIITENYNRLTAGEYEVKLYCDGELAGESTFILK